MTNLPDRIEQASEERRCETCALLKVAVPNCECMAIRAANVDYRWEKSEIPMGRFVSEKDYLVPCPLYEGPISSDYLEQRKRIADKYVSKLSDKHEWVNRFAAALRANEGEG